MDPQPSKVLQPLGTPLFPIPPDRINQQKLNAATVLSAEISPLQNKHARTGSDVQAKVAFLNSLSRNHGPVPTLPSSTTTAALQRAILGREEAESALQATILQLSEANARERRVSERLESLLEELQSLKERQAHERGIFEKEVRRARKEAFRAGSALVKSQEELKFSRGEIKGLKDEVQSERDAKSKATQEAFERAYALAGLTEELEVLKEKLRASETDNQSDILEARAEEMRGETPTKRFMLSQRGDGLRSPTPRKLNRGPLDLGEPRSSSRMNHYHEQHRPSPRLGSPLKMSQISRRSSCKENLDPEFSIKDNVIEQLKGQLLLEKRLRVQAEDMVHFLKMECQFSRCSCRIAESRGIRYIHDIEWDKICQAENRRESRRVETPGTHDRAAGCITPTVTKVDATVTCDELANAEVQHSESLMEFCEDTGTFHAARPSMAQGDSITENFQPQEDKRTKVAQVLAEASQSPVQQSSPCQLVTSLEVEGPSETPTTARDQKDISPLSAALPPHSSEIANSSCPLQRNLTIQQAPFSTQEELADNTTPKMAEVMTTTTTVPLLPENGSSGDFCAVPSTPVSREQALAQIRARRDRTQTALKRSASANDANPCRPTPNPSTTPVRGGRRIPRMENAGSRTDAVVPRRDISAPVRSC